MRLRHGLFAALSTGGSNWSTTCPVITPTAGADRITNGEFTSDYTGWTANNATLSVVDSTSDPGTASGGADNNCLKVVDAGGSAGAITGDIGAAVGWYRASCQAYAPSANSNQKEGSLTFGYTSGGEDYGRLTNSLENTWQTLLFTFRSISTVLYASLYCYGSPTNDTYYFDAVSAVPLTLASQISLLRTNSTKNGTYICHPTVVDNTQCGMLINYKDANNFMMAIVDRNGTDSARLLKRVSGTYTELKSGAITYVAGADLKVVVSGTTFQLFYNNSQVSTDATFDNSGMGLDIYGFTTYASSTVGVVSANP